MRNILRQLGALAARRWLLCAENVSRIRRCHTPLLHGDKPTQLPYTVPFDRGAAEHHARIRHLLRRQPIGERDLLTASVALAYDLTLVTHNAAEFSRVPELRVEDWTAS
jgi:hypothetical protein